MRVLMLSWEYPPLVVGGLGRHVEALARELAAAGHDVRVVARGEKHEVVDEVVDGVQVRRAAADPIAIDFTTESLLAWSQAVEHSVLRAALPMLADWTPDVVHAHDWLVAQSAITLGASAAAPVVATIHATESGRHQGHLPQPLHRAIDSIERWLVQSADQVIACSPSMRTEVLALFAPLPARVSVVPNGIDASRWRLPARERAQARSRVAADGPVLAFAGRLVHEKGLQTLFAALPRLRRRHRGLRVVVAGTGPYEDELRAQAARLRITGAVDWLGFAPDHEIVELFAGADAVVVPSRYEPFGIVALEAVASGTPLIAADVGGLHDAIEAGYAAASFTREDVTGLAAAVDTVLADPDGARRRGGAMAEAVARDCAWATVAASTVEVYRRAVDERAVGERGAGGRLPGRSAP